MTRKRKKPQNKKKTYNSLLKTAILVSVAFLLGIGIERSSIDLDGVAGYASHMLARIQNWTEQFYPKSEPSNDFGELHFFDVGQGSSTLLKANDGTTILIDTGRYNDSSKRIINYLNSEIGVGGNIDLLIFTHNDADHIGNGDLVMDYFQVNEVWMNGMDHTSQVYSDVLDAILDSTAEYVEPKRGDTKEVGPFTVEVLHPGRDLSGSNQNNGSIATRITLGNTVFMQTGDVSTRQEKDIIEWTHHSLQSDIILLGHHGSNTSTDPEWIEAVNPAIAIYQAAPNNSYGHPHAEVLDQLDAYGIPVYGTDVSGTITIEVDERGEMTVITEED